MSQKEQREVERNHLLIPTIGRLKVLSNRELSVLFDRSVTDAVNEVADLARVFGYPDAIPSDIEATRQGVRDRIETYTQLDDAACLIEAVTEELLEIASDMRHIAREMCNRDTIDG